jgi:signal transduction histidine kinase
MVAAADVLFAVVLGVGLALAGLSWALRTSDSLGVTALRAFAAVFGAGVAATGVVGLVARDPEPLVQPLWAQIGFFFWAVSVVPWFLFALAYTGRYTDPTRRVVAGLWVPFLVPFGNFVWLNAGGSPSGVLNALSSIVFIYGLSLAVFGALLVLQATRSYVHLSVWDGLGLVATPVLAVIALNSTGNLQQSALVLAPLVYTLALVVGTAALWAVVARGSALDRPPAIERIGRRAIARQTDDLVFIVDEDEVVVECNSAAVEMLPATRAALLAAPASETLGADLATLRDRETITVDTVAGERQYDPQVSTLGADPIGAVLSLRDVTDRQLREQRLAVLNRVLRHNLRNKLDVIKSHAEVLEGEEHTATITDTADELDRLGNEARRIDQFLSASSTTEVTLADALGQACDGADPRPDVAVAVDCPPDTSVTTNREALQAALDSAVENALSYADSAVDIDVERRADGYEVAISDDGSGIPELELRSLDSGTETPLQHGTGLGLWQLKWAVTTIGGELSIETTDGTTVQFTVPDLS